MYVIYSPLYPLVSLLSRLSPIFFFFFFNDTATTEIYTLSLHDALPISLLVVFFTLVGTAIEGVGLLGIECAQVADRKSTRLNSSHSQISYAVFCLKKKKKTRKYDYQDSN